jgi:hypothetical protein
MRFLLESTAGQWVWVFQQALSNAVGRAQDPGLKVQNERIGHRGSWVFATHDLLNSAAFPTALQPAGSKEWRKKQLSPA